MALLIIATLIAPIIALIFADWWRQRKREAKLDEEGKTDG